MNNNIPNNITFQWHVTEICNLRCKHCYQEDYLSIGLPFDQLLSILEQFQHFVKNHKIKKAHINITGGEPFLREDLIELLFKIKETNLFTFGILSNGYIPSKETLNKLEIAKPKFIQISLEGNEKTNDLIRGKGSYNQIIQSLKVYKKLGIPTMVSFTANTENYKEFGNVVKIARKHKAFKVWTDRYLPSGKNDYLQLNTQQFKELGEIINKEKIKNKYHIFSKTNISANRALQFLFCGGLPYRCSAGDNLLAIQSNGDLLPCRRLPITIGNLMTDNLDYLYENSVKLIGIRNRNNLDKKCSDCYYKLSCNGGLKCLSYAIFKDFTQKDINCWI